MLIIITPPHALPYEECIVNKLFESGLHLLHLRKPGADRETLERYIRGIRPRFRERVILHDHFELAEEYGLRGIHLKYNEARTFTGRNRFAHVRRVVSLLRGNRRLAFRAELRLSQPGI